jgi:hypothetical protein
MEHDHVEQLLKRNRNMEGEEGFDYLHVSCPFLNNEKIDNIDIDYDDEYL